MDLETRYSNRISFLLKEQSVILEKELQTILRSASSKGALGSGSTVMRIKECCEERLKLNIDLLVNTSIEMVNLSKRNISFEKLWKITQPYIASQFASIDEAKLKAMKTNQPSNIPAGVIEAASIVEKYRLFESEAKYKMENELLVLKEQSGKTLRDRVMNKLNNSWLYLIIVVIVAFVGWLKG